MPTSIDVVPSIGHALLTSQLGVGSTPGYDAIDIRRLAMAGPQEGVHDPGAWKVSEATPNSLTVNVAANVGLATVQGDAVASQGLYVVAPHSAVISPTVTAAHASLPRIDQIVVRAYDATHDGGSDNKATVEVVTGTATSGATLSNRTGAAALPGGALRVADVLVSPSATTITNAKIQDRRRWANGAVWTGLRGSDVTRFSTTWVEVDTGTLQARLETADNPVLISFTANGDGSANSNSDLLVSAWIDGNLVDAQKFAQVSGGVTNRPCNFTLITAPGSGSHLFTAVMESTAGDGVTIRGTSRFNVRELVAPNANNGTT
jgi:hypothetical protein